MYHESLPVNTGVSIIESTNALRTVIKAWLECFITADVQVKES